MKGTERDNQRSRVYKAERCLRVAPDRMTLEACQAYVDGITAGRWWRRHWPTSPGVTVKDGRGSRRARVDASHRGFCLQVEMEVPRWARDPAVLLHELAHVAHDTAQRNRHLGMSRNPSYVAEAPHGWQFCQTFLRLVRHYLGVEQEARLRASFKEHRVRYKRPRQLSEKQREALRQRMLRLRRDVAAKERGLP